MVLPFPGERCNSFDHVDNLLLVKTLQYDRKHNMSPYTEESKIANQKQRPLWDSKGSRFTLGVWGLRVCSLDVAFTSATVRNRPQPSAVLLHGRAYGKFCRRGHFWRFQTSRCFVSRGSHGTSWHSDVFCNVSKVVLCGKRDTFATFFRRCVAVFVAGAALWTCPSSFCVASAAL